MPCFTFVLGLSLSARRRIRGSKLQDGKERREKRGLGIAPHGKANPSRCYVAKSRQAEQAGIHSNNNKALTRTGLQVIMLHTHTALCTSNKGR
ncbi:hypothetical protein CCMA1212_000057 [Trichoderma ghanense]|uniref:Secreted protein n=1 Tax=Trichoderma ghanense TaxID=65468 RepID=A0ABY2HGX4_9HYPO